MTMHLICQRLVDQKFEVNTSVAEDDKTNRCINNINSIRLILLIIACKCERVPYPKTFSPSCYGSNFIKLHWGSIPPEYKK